MDRYDFSCESTIYKWKRPIEINFPMVWRRFMMKSRTGQIHKIRVQDICPNQYDEVWNMFKTYYFAEEELQRSAKTIDDEVTMNSLKWSTFQYLKQNVSLITVLDEESPEPTIIGGLLLTVNSRDDPPFPLLPGEAREKIQNLEDILVEGLEKLKLSHYFDDYGLVVKPNYRRLGIGSELRKTIGEMAKKYKVPAAVEMYHNTSSQLMAAKLGYTVLNEVKLSDYVDERGQVILPIKNTKVVQLCYRKFV